MIEVKHLILVTGPHASGKTTTVERVLLNFKDHSELKIILADSVDKSTYFKGPMDKSREMIREVWEGERSCLLMEGSVRIAILTQQLSSQISSRKITIFATSMLSQDMRASLITRCVARGKKFNESYWDVKKLIYEGTKRFGNLLARVSGAEIHWYIVDRSYSACDDLAADLTKTLTEILEAPNESQ